jgi:hydrogenase maturation protease
MGAPLYIGVGNRFRSDDGVGPWVAERLGAAGRDARVHAGDGAGLLELFQRRGEVNLVDATRSAAAPGTVVCLDVEDAPLPAGFFHYSTHRFGLAEAVETARALGLLPERMRIYGVEGREFGAGTGLSAPVERAAQGLVDALLSGRAPAGRRQDATEEA